MIHGEVSIERLGLLRNDALGDTLLVLPVASAVKQIDSGVHVELVCNGAFTELLSAHPDLDDVHADPGGRVGVLSRLLKSRRFDALLVMRPTPRNALAAVWANIPLRVGTANRFYGPLFNVRWYGHRSRNLQHEVLYNLELLQKLTDAQYGAPQYYLPPPPADREAARAVLSSAGVQDDRPLIALHPGSRLRPDGSYSHLLWPAASFSELAAALMGDGVQVVVTGSTADADLAGPVREVEGVVDLIGRTTLGQLAWILKQCDTVVANSTGPLHLAAAVGTKVIGLYPAAAGMSPVRWGPFGTGHKVFTPPPEICNETVCTLERCPEFNCLERITPAAVRDVALGMTSQSPHRSRREGPERTGGTGEGGSP